MKKAVSGIQPSGRLTLGNYVGAIKQFITLQNEYDLYVFIANLHAITVPLKKNDLVLSSKQLVAFYLAAGLDPKKVTIFLQSDVLMHTQLGWILTCQTYMGELSRMTQYKDKSTSKGENIGVGLFTYPSLMAADILLYDADFVPVGEDQRQHLEFTRDVAQRFNNRYGETFIVPEAHIKKQGAKIMSLSDPTKKMSKSDPSGDKSCIYLTDTFEQITKKIKSATTDNLKQITYDVENQPGISNLLTIYSQLNDISIDDTVDIFKNYNYADFKDAIAKTVCDTLIPLQERFNEILSSNLDDILLEGSNKANKIAYKKLMKVQNKIGLNLKRM